MKKDAKKCSAACGIRNPSNICAAESKNICVIDRKISPCQLSLLLQKNILPSKLGQPKPLGHVVWLSADPVALVLLTQFAWKFLLL